MPYHPMKGYMQKIDDWGASQSSKIRSQQNAGSNASVGDRFKLARGVDDRWERTKKTEANDEDPHNIVPQRNGTNLPPPPTTAKPTMTTSRGPPPRPPQRGGGSTNAPAVASSSRGTAPALPNRMNNEAGIANPPPSYGQVTAPPAPPARSITPSTSSSNPRPRHIEFSKFTQEDKEAFFDLLDEFFASRVQMASSRSDPPSQRGRLDATSSTSPRVSSVLVGAPRNPSGPWPQRSTQKVSSPAPIPSPTPPKITSTSYPILSASAHPLSEICSALSCATFFCHPDSYPEWSGSRPWFVQGPGAVPLPLVDRKDVARSAQSMYRGTEHTMNGCALFGDLSCLWWQITWDSSDPSSSVRCQVAYRKPPSAWQEEERLKSAAEGYGDWIAGFAEDVQAKGQKVGDGECWTLANEAILYTNETAQLTEENRLMKTIGRTHGFLLFAGKAGVEGQVGRWRGGDRIRNHWGGVRRGDIVEWRSAKCKEKGMPRGSYVTLGFPEHTAIVVDNSPLPDRLTPGLGEECDLYKVLGVARNATQADIRAAYLASARSHHPDKVQGHDAHIRKLNEAHSTLNDFSSRQAYDASLQAGKASSFLVRQNKERISAMLDLDSFDATEPESGREAEGLRFSHPCRCGSGFVFSQKEVEEQGRSVISCAGCSEKVKVAGLDSLAESQEKSGYELEEEDQPEVAPWEIGSITVIEQGGGQLPSKKTYDLSRDSFTEGEMWIYRPVPEAQYLGGAISAQWPPNLPGWEQLV